LSKYLCYQDFDSPLYAAATICQTNYIEATHIKSGHKKEFKNVTEFWGRGNKIGGWLSDQKKEFTRKDFSIEQLGRRSSVPFSKAQDILIKQIEAVEAKGFCEELKLVVGGTGNYRFDIFPGYKAGRPQKPIVFNELKEWLKSERDLIIEDGVESDDVVSIVGHYGYNKALKSGDYKDDNICLIYIDKDITQVPGWAWHPKKKLFKPTWVTEFQASESFWCQMLQGDTTDNIPGLKDVTDEVWKNYKLRGQRGIGSGNAKKLLKGCQKTIDREQKVLYLYESYYSSIEGGDWQKEFQLNYQLLKLQDQKGVIPKYEFEKE
jgi:hypothetical protein